MSEKILAWHFTNGMKLRDGRQLVVGKTYHLPKDKHPVLCKVGYHGSERISDAIKYAPGFMLSRTEHGGEIVRGDDKLASSERTVLWCVDADKIVRRAAIMFARHALAVRKKAGKATDPRSWAALRVAELYLDGKATWEEVVVAANAADVAYAADVDYDAANAAAAAYAAAGATYAATYAGAYAGAFDAAAVAAVGQAERDWQERYLVRMVNKARKEE